MVQISFIVMLFSDVGVAIGNKNRYILVQVHSATVMDSKFKPMAIKHHLKFSSWHENLKYYLEILKA